MDVVSANSRKGAVSSTLSGPHLPERFSSLVAFLKRPRLPERATGVGLVGLYGVGRLYLIDLLAMCALGIMALLAVALGVEFPENQLDAIELTPGWIALIVLGAPLMEELLFRSWLSGRPGHVGGALALGAGVAGGGVLTQSHDVAAVGLLAVGLVLAAVLIFVLRRHGPMRWFAFLFPAIFWIVTALFAAVHMFNYTEGSLAMLLPLVVPQFIAGALFGYARVQYGLWAAILLHALHNGSAVLLILLLGDAMPGG